MSLAVRAGMIRTFALNPAVDVSLVVSELVPVRKLRATSTRREVGGGGVNVARLLVRMGSEVECVVAAGGATGAEVVAALVGAEIVVTELPAGGMTRESIQIHDVASDLRYRVVVDGPPLTNTPKEIISLLAEAQAPDVNVFSGSLPSGCPPAIYADLSEVHARAFTIVDTSGAALAASVTGSIDLLKPCLSELESLVGQEIHDAAMLERVTIDLLEKNGSVGSVLTSLGAAGAVLGQRDRPMIHFRPPDVRVVSAVGAGDSMVAGVAWSISRGKTIVDACRFGVAAGTATVATPGSALCTRADAEALVDAVEVSELGPELAIT